MTVPQALPGTGGGIKTQVTWFLPAPHPLYQSRSPGQGGGE